MKSNHRRFLSDLKAAVRIGHPEAVEMALNNLRTLPFVSSNDQLPVGFIKSVIHPSGRTLSRRPVLELSRWCAHQLTAYRALAAASLAYRYMSAGDVDPKLLHNAANDNRSEVRLVLGQALSKLAEDNSTRSQILAVSWLQDDAPKVRATALGFIPSLAASSQHQIIGWLQPLGNDFHDGVRLALVEALKTMADAGHTEIIFALLEDWVSRPHPNIWLITRTISGSWAVSHPEEISGILMQIQSKTKGDKEITTVLKALQRHGLKLNLELSSNVSDEK